MDVANISGIMEQLFRDIFGLEKEREKESCTIQMDPEWRLIGETMYASKITYSMIIKNQE